MFLRKPLLVRVGLTLLVVGMLASLSLIPSAASTQNLTFNPAADGYVDASNPSTNYGTGATLRADSSPVVNSYLRFTVSGLGGQPVTQARLLLYANSASTQGLVAKSVTDNSWGETTLNSSNAPAIGTTLATSAAVTAGSWITLDVTSFVSGEGTFSFGVSTLGSTAISLASRESGANAAQLIVTTTSAATPTTTKLPATNTAIATKPATTSTPTTVGGQNLNLTPAADSYIESTYPTTNYGTLVTLRMDTSPVVNSYLRFTVSGVNGKVVTQARLLIYANTASPQGLVAKSVADNTWGESTLTYNNAPAMGTTLATSAAVSAATRVTLDVTSYITGDGTFSIGVSTAGSTAISLASRESGANAPQLILSFSGSSTPVPTTKPTATPAASRTPTLGVTPTKTKTQVPPTATSGVPTATSPSSCTAVVLTKGPTLIYTGTNTKMRVFWQWSSNVAFQMQWGTDTSYTQGNVAVNPTDTTNHLYTYDISGLTPGAKYFYRVVTGSQCSSATFYAAPASTASTVKFISYGDTRTNGSIHNGLAGQVVSLFQSDPAFQTFNINVGDWVSADSESAWTSEWFASAYTNLRKQDANIADIGVRGNHEGAATFWKRYWPEPFQSAGLYWSFDYGPMHIAMLDAYTSYSAGSAQYNWLKADLAASTKTWKFVVIHEPGWSAGGGHANNTTVQNDLQPLFVQYGVSILFSGHNHYYARASVNGVTHLTLGGGGAPQYTPASGQPNIVVTSKSYSFGEFTISGNTLTAKIVNNSGATVDTFTITR